MNAIRIMNLKRKRLEHPYCGKCTFLRNQIDNIDDSSEKLLEKINNSIERE